MTCRIERCPNDEREGKSLCPAHESRKYRLGDPESRVCSRCGGVFRDPELRQGSALCPSCSVGGRMAYVALTLTPTQAEWVESHGKIGNVMRTLLNDAIERDQKEPPMERGERERMPNPARSTGYKCRLGGCGFYVSVNVYDDDRVGAVFVDLGKVGSPLNAIFKAWCVSVSKSLQFGVPLLEVIESFEPQEKELPIDPSGFLQCEEVPDIHGKRYPHVWAVVVDILKHEVDERGRLRSLIEVETRPSKRRAGGG